MLLSLFLFLTREMRNRLTDWARSDILKQVCSGERTAMGKGEDKRKFLENRSTPYNNNDLQMQDRRENLKHFSQNYAPEVHMSLTPMAEIEGFPVRPGLFDVHGAMMLPVGVNFTVHTHYGTSCTLLLFHRNAVTPYARLPFPEAYKIGDVYSMIVFGLDIEEFEYAYQVDGPFEPENGLTFDKEIGRAHV